MADECIFCKIVRKEVPSQPIHEDHDMVALPDINPVAPVHVLVVPKEHMVNLNEAGVKDIAVLGKMLRLAAKIARSAISERISATAFWRSRSISARDLARNSSADWRARF